jgi:hypothetical protein
MRVKGQGGQEVIIGIFTRHWKKWILLLGEGLPSSGRKKIRLNVSTRDEVYNCVFVLIMECLQLIMFL